MKSVLISIQPEWCELIASGKKTVEVRKTKPKIETPFKVYIYRTKGFVRHLCNNKWWNMPVGGEVIGEFVCDKIVEFENSWYDPAFDETSTFSCVNVEELARYIGKNDYGYGWHISDLVIYDKPKELSEFKPICRWMNDDFSCMYQKVECGKVKFDINPDNTVNLAECTRRLSKAPQSWCYVVGM